VGTSYKVRAYPTPEQVAVSNRTFGCVALVWSKALAWRQARYRTHGAATSYAQTDWYLTELKHDPDLGFLPEVSCVPLQQTLRHQHTAFVNLFAGRARYPRYKSRQARQSATYTRSAFRWRDGRLYLAKMMDTPLEVVWSWPAPPAGAAVSVDLGIKAESSQALIPPWKRKPYRRLTNRNMTTTGMEYRSENVEISARFGCPPSV
jgi:transposase